MEYIVTEHCGDMSIKKVFVGTPDEISKLVYLLENELIVVTGNEPMVTTTGNERDILDGIVK